MERNEKPEYVPAPAGFMDISRELEKIQKSEGVDNPVPAPALDCKDTPEERAAEFKAICAAYPQIPERVLRIICHAYQEKCCRLLKKGFTPKEIAVMTNDPKFSSSIMKNFKYWKKWVLTNKTYKRNGD